MMKKLLFFITFITMVINVNSQTDELVCGYDFFENENNSFTQMGSFSFSTDPTVLYAKEPKVLNVFFWQVNQFEGHFGDDENPQPNITEQEALSAIANLNMEFNQYNIFFKYRGLDQFNSPQTVYLQEPNGYGCINILDDQGDPIEDNNGFNTLDNSCQFRQLYDYAADNDYMPIENINIFIPFATVGIRAAGYYSPPKIIIKREDFDNEIMIHEMGHVLYLSHTHRGHRDLEDPLDEDAPIYTDCEHVTRDPDDPDNNYNAESKGDIITDTAAAPDFWLEHYYELLEQGYSEEYAAANDTIQKYISPINCSYTGSGKDCIGETYQMFPSDTKNVMSYTLDNCLDTFTIGQAIRMHEIVELWPDNYNETTIPELFEPYSGEYYVSGPQQSEHPPLFQPGFEYRFVECESNIDTPVGYGEPFTYSVNTVLLSIPDDETDYHSITHPNHSAILIKHQYGDFLDKPEKCYDNWNRKPSSGLVTKFNDDVFNTNVTITAQDSTSINNQNLIENLENGLYKIDKNYEDGSSQETVIYKGNN